MYVVQVKVGLPERGGAEAGQEDVALLKDELAAGQGYLCEAGGGSQEQGRRPGPAGDPGGWEGKELVLCQ